MSNPNLKTIISEDLRTHVSSPEKQDLETDNVLLEPEKLAALEREILDEIAEECKENPYHNVEHTEEVMQRVDVLAAHAKLPLVKRQLLRIGGLGHDYGHAG